MKTLCIYGASGLGKETLEIAKSMKKWNNILFVDDNLFGNKINEVQVVSFNYVVENYDAKATEFVIALGEPYLRQTLHEKVVDAGLELSTLFHRSNNVPGLSSFSEGSIVHMNVSVACDLYLGKSVYINKAVVLGHDVEISDFSVISPNVTIGGNVTIGKHCYIGSGAIIKNDISIGNGSIVGMGAVVLENVPEHVVMVGNPARFIRKNHNKRVFN